MTGKPGSISGSPPWSAASESERARKARKGMCLAAATRATAAVSMSLTTIGSFGYGSGPPPPGANDWKRSIKKNGSAKGAAPETNDTMPGEVFGAGDAGEDDPVDLDRVENRARGRLGIDQADSGEPEYHALPRDRPAEEPPSVEGADLGHGLSVTEQHGLLGRKRREDQQVVGRHRGAPECRCRHRGGHCPSEGSHRFSPGS